MKKRILGSVLALAVICLMLSAALSVAAENGEVIPVEETESLDEPMTEETPKEDVEHVEGVEELVEATPEELKEEFPAETVPVEEIEEIVEQVAEFPEEGVIDYDGNGIDAPKELIKQLIEKLGVDELELLIAEVKAEMQEGGDPQENSEPQDISAAEDEGNGDVTLPEEDGNITGGGEDDPDDGTGTVLSGGSLWIILGVAVAAIAAVVVLVIVKKKKT